MAYRGNQGTIRYRPYAISQAENFLESFEQPVRCGPERVSIEKGHVVREQQNTYEDQQHAPHDVNWLYVPAEGLGKLKERVDRHGA